jgi:hypothetical protein
VCIYLIRSFFFVRQPADVMRCVDERRSMPCWKFCRTAWMVRFIIRLNCKLSSMSSYNTIHSSFLSVYHYFSLTCILQNTLYTNWLYCCGYFINFQGCSRCVIVKSGLTKLHGLSLRGHFEQQKYNWISELTVDRLFGLFMSTYWNLLAFEQWTEMSNICYWTVVQTSYIYILYLSP